MQEELSEANWTLAEDQMTVKGSFVVGFLQDVSRGSTSKVTYRDCTFRCNLDLVPQLLEAPEVDPAETCQREADKVPSYSSCLLLAGHVTDSILMYVLYVVEIKK